MLLVQINPGEKKGTVVPGRNVPVVEDVEGRQLAPQHLHGHHVDDQHPDGTVKDFNLLINNSNIFRKKSIHLLKILLVGLLQFQEKYISIVQCNTFVLSFVMYHKIFSRIILIKINGEKTIPICIKTKN